MSDIEDSLRKSHHLAILFYREVNKIYKEMQSRIKQSNGVDEFINSEFIKDTCTVGIVAEKAALDLKDIYLALGSLGAVKYGAEFIKGIAADITATTVADKSAIKNGETPLSLTCSCSECSTIADDAVAMAKIIAEKALKENK